jgi:hypothetical protein
MISAVNKLNRSAACNFPLLSEEILDDPARSAEGLSVKTMIPAVLSTGALSVVFFCGGVRLVLIKVILYIPANFMPELYLRIFSLSLLKPIAANRFLLLMNQLLSSIVLTKPA